MEIFPLKPLTEHISICGYVYYVFFVSVILCFKAWNKMSQTHKVRPNVPKCCPIPIYTVCPVQPLTQTLKGDVS